MERGGGACSALRWGSNIEADRPTPARAATRATTPHPSHSRPYGNRPFPKNLAAQAAVVADGWNSFR